jgi:quercetin dioxygenase-like cupin family protein
MRLLRSGRTPWIEGKGYRKRPLVPEEELEIEGSFIQEVDFVPGESVPLHFHRRTREVFIALDRAVFQINGEQIAMEPMDVLICDPGDVHGNPIIEQRSRILVVKQCLEPDDTVWL